MGRAPFVYCCIRFRGEDGKEIIMKEIKFTEGTKGILSDGRKITLHRICAKRDLGMLNKGEAGVLIEKQRTIHRMYLRCVGLFGRMRRKCLEHSARCLRCTAASEKIAGKWSGNRRSAGCLEGCCRKCMEMRKVSGRCGEGVWQMRRYLEMRRCIGKDSAVCSWKMRGCHWRCSWCLEMRRSFVWRFARCLEMPARCLEMRRQCVPGELRRVVWKCRWVYGSMASGVLEECAGVMEMRGCMRDAAGCLEMRQVYGDAQRVWKWRRRCGWRYAR